MLIPASNEDALHLVGGVPDVGDELGTHKASPRISTEWQVLDPARPLFLGCCCGDQLKVFHPLADCDPKLMCVDDAGEVLCSLSRRAASRRRSSSWETRTRPSSVARCNKRSSFNSAAPSSCAVSTSIERKRKGRHCTSYVHVHIFQSASDLLIDFVLVFIVVG
jgi:hypothetical protein